MRCRPRPPSTATSGAIPTRRGWRACRASSQATRSRCAGCPSRRAASTSRAGQSRQRASARRERASCRPPRKTCTSRWSTAGAAARRCCASAPTHTRATRGRRCTAATWRLARAAGTSRRSLPQTMRSSNQSTWATASTSEAEQSLQAAVGIGAWGAKNPVSPSKSRGVGGAYPRVYLYKLCVAATASLLFLAKRGKWRMWLCP
mmetsp:Transcript_840/g.2398  ORF Transcript_840/g.2398 Transcript_840/m.2398 type:complete len:204 (+) Transcript_840:590-1201(+)